MSAKPIDEFLQDCTVWLEKIAAAKQREEAAYAVINEIQMEKKAARFLARGAGHIARGVGRGISAGGRALSRLGSRMLRWGSKPKVNTSLQNPLAQQVSAALKSGNPQPRLLRTADGRVVLSSPTKAAPANAPKASPAPAQAPAPSKAPVEAPAPAAKTAPAPASAAEKATAPAAKTAPAPAQTPTPAPAAEKVTAPTADLSKRLRVDAKGNVYSLKTGQKYTGARLARLKLSPEQISQLQKFQKAKGIHGQFTSASNKFRADNGMSQLFNSKMQRVAPANAPVKAPTAQPTQAKPAPQQQAKPADPKAPVEAPKGGQSAAGAETAAGAEAATAKPGMFGKILPYALVGGAGFIGGRSTAPEPTYTSPAMEHNNMVYQQQQQAATPNIY